MSVLWMTDGGREMGRQVRGVQHSCTTHSVDFVVFLPVEDVFWRRYWVTLGDIMPGSQTGSRRVPRFSSLSAGGSPLPSSHALCRYCSRFYPKELDRSEAAQKR